MYIDANDMPKAKKAARKMKKMFGMAPKPPIAVDLEFGFVPTNVSQSAKGGKANIKKTAEMNDRRFDYKEAHEV